jgi:hypothetical protein
MFNSANKINAHAMSFSSFHYYTISCIDIFCCGYKKGRELEINKHEIEGLRNTGNIFPLECLRMGEG